MLFHSLTVFTISSSVVATVTLPLERPAAKLPPVTALLMPAQAVVLLVEEEPIA